MGWLSQRYFWFWDADDGSGLADQGVPVNPQTGFTSSYVFIEGGWMVGGPAPACDLRAAGSQDRCVKKKGDPTSPLKVGTSCRHIQATFESFGDIILYHPSQLHALFFSSEPIHLVGSVCKCMGEGPPTRAGATCSGHTSED